MSDNNLLEKLFQILKDEGVLQPKKDDPVVRFKDPEDLLKIFDFTVDGDSPLSETKVETLLREIMKYSTKTSHPHFHGILFAGYDSYGLLASWMMEALNTCSITYDLVPMFALIENAVIKKLLELYGIPNGDGIFTPGGSLATLYALTLARFKRYPDVKRRGMWGMKPLVIFTSRESHYCSTKGANWLGIGEENVIEIETNERGEMLMKDLVGKIEKSIEEGKEPYFVNATSGTTVLGAFDDLQEIAVICRKYGLWMHVDGCYGGHVIFSEKYKKLMDGSSHADSISYCAQKMGGAPMQCAVFLTRHKGLLLECNAAGAGYVFPKQKHYDTSFDPGDKSIQCGKKVDGFKLWLILKARGLKAIQENLENIFYCANFLTDIVKNRSNFRLVIENRNSPSVCFWYIPKKFQNVEENVDFWAEIDKITYKIHATLVRNGRQMLGMSKLPKYHSANFFRVALVGHPRPSEESMTAILEDIEQVVKELNNFN